MTAHAMHDLVRKGILPKGLPLGRIGSVPSYIGLTERFTLLLIGGGGRGARVGVGLFPKFGSRNWYLNISDILG